MLWLFVRVNDGMVVQWPTVIHFLPFFSPLIELKSIHFLLFLDAFWDDKVDFFLMFMKFVSENLIFNKMRKHGGPRILTINKAQLLLECYTIVSIVINLGSPEMVGKLAQQLNWKMRWYGTRLRRVKVIPSRLESYLENASKSSNLNELGT